MAAEIEPSPAAATGLAGRYATALFDLADRDKALDAVAADLARLKAMLDDSADLRRVVESPLIARDAQAKTVAALVARAELSDLTRRFMGVVAANRRLPQLAAIAEAYTAILAARRGETTAEIVSARPLNPAQAQAIGGALQGALGRKVTARFKVDPALIAGLKVKVGSRLFDASLESKLQRLQLAMKRIG